MEETVESDIRLFVSCHKPAYVPEHRLLYPVHAGAALSDIVVPSFHRDDAGDNISTLNRRYCELTVQYWAWKNVSADYYGFFHYRRYLYPDPKARLPYCVRRRPSAEVMERLRLDDLRELIPEYDLIITIPEDMHVTVRDHYTNAPFHHGEDLRLTEEIIKEKFPEFAPAMEQYLSGTKQHFMNIAIMRRDVLQDYCEWLFTILGEFDKRADMTNYNEQEMRVDGYLGERLLGIYYTHRKSILKTLELPRVHFEENASAYWKRIMLNMLLPPGTKRRACLKRAYVSTER